MKPVILKADMNLIDSGKRTVISLKETRAAYIVTVKALRKNSNLEGALVVDAPERLEGDDRSDIDLYTWDVTYDIFEATDCDYTPITWANIPAIDAWISEVAQAANTRNTKEINKIKEPVKVDTTNVACIVDTGSDTPTLNEAIANALNKAIAHGDSESTQAQYDRGYHKGLVDAGKGNNNMHNYRYSATYFGYTAAQRDVSYFETHGEW